MRHLKNFLFKREQSQARLRFAKCEKSRLLARTLLTLVALLALTTQAWAADPYEEFTTAEAIYTQKEFTGDHIKITGTYIDEDGFLIGAGETVTISALNGKIITKVEMTISYVNKDWDNSCAILSTPNATIEGRFEVGQKLTLTGANASEIVLTATNGTDDTPDVSIETWKVYYGDVPSITPVPLTRGTGDKANEWTFTNGMPAGNVLVNVVYYPMAEFAKNNAETPLKPKTKYDAHANGDMPLVEAGVVANIKEGTTELDKKQGTLVYHVSTTPLTDLTAEALEALLDDAEAWSEDVPTAAKIKQACTVYVYYYIRGADNVEGSTAGVTHTFNDSDIQMLTVNVQPEPVYDVELNDATAEAANWKAKVGTGEPSDNDVFPLTGVTKGQKVTVKYKGDRKVIGVKAEKLDLTTKVWKPGDKFHIGQAWFYYDENDQNKCFHANGVESEVTNFNYDNNFKQWYLQSFVIVDKQIDTETESQLSPAKRPIWFSIPAGKISSDTPVGFKIISGDGSKDSPYKFGLVY